MVLDAALTLIAIVCGGAALVGFWNYFAEQSNHKFTKDCYWEEIEKNRHLQDRLARRKVPSAADNPDGLHGRYEVKRLDGETDPDAFYFVLRLDSGGSDPHHINACRAAAVDYSFHITANPDAGHLHKMATELRDRVRAMVLEDAKDGEEKDVNKGN